MDQATPADQDLHRHQPQLGDEPSLRGNDCLLAPLLPEVLHPLAAHPLRDRQALEVSLFDRFEMRALLAPRVGSRVDSRQLDRPVQLSFKWFADDSEEQRVLDQVQTRVTHAETLVAQPQ